MRDVMDKIDGWLAEDQDLMLATVVKVWGSAPRPLGSHMVQSSQGGIAGSVSGGCVEGAVLEEGQGILESGESRLLSFGRLDDISHEGMELIRQIRVIYDNYGYETEILAASIRCAT